MSDHKELIAEARLITSGDEWVERSGRVVEASQIASELAGALEAALATIERVRKLEPTWHRGMYGSPDDMFSAISIHRALEATQ